MTTADVMKQLEQLADPQTRKTHLRHGCPEPLFGVKIANLKTLVKQIKRDTTLAKELYRTRNSDAMYLAGMIADGKEMSRKDLDDWARGARWHMISGSTVPAVATEHPEGWDLAMKWIDSPDEHVSVAGWNTLAGFVATKADDDLDLKAVEKLLSRVTKTIHAAPNHTRYAMNAFVISVGSYIKPLTGKAIAAAEKIGEVEVDMGDTACKVPDAAAYIQKVIDRGNHGKKRKTMRC